MSDIGRILPDPQGTAGCVVWEIEDVSALGHRHSIFSSDISLLDATWFFAIESYTDNKSDPHTELALQLRLSCPCPKSTLSYRIGIRGKGGVELAASSGDIESGKRRVSSIITPSLLQRPDLNTWAPGGRLTVFCTLRRTDGTRKAPHRTPGRDIAVQTGDFGEDSKDSDGAQPASCNATGLQRLGQDMMNLFLSERDTDLTLMVRDRPFRVHRAVLGVRSPVFQAMLEHDMIERRNSVVEIEDCEPGAFGDFLLHLYSGTVEGLSESNVLHLYKAADKYGVEHLKAEYLKFMKTSLSVDSFCDIIKLALQHDESELLQDTTEFFAKNLKKIVISAAWQTFVMQNGVASNELYIKALKHKGIWDEE